MEVVKIPTKGQVDFINITSQIKKIAADSGIDEGTCTVYCPHTTAGITINEAADPAVVRDIIKELDSIVPLHHGYTHGEGNSAAHIKSSLVGASEVVPVHQGALVLGTWQGIYFCEFDGPRHRKAYITICSTV
jgi:secondary thiamine-phosphate synthase enzyme